MTDQELMEAIIARASTDPAFRAALIASPVEALRDSGLAVDEAFLARVSQVSGADIAAALGGLGDGPRRAAS
jgi:hypothetical protein